MEKKKDGKKGKKKKKKGPDEKIILEENIFPRGKFWKIFLEYFPRINCSLDP